MLQKASEFEPLHSRDDKEVSDLISFYENPRRETLLRLWLKLLL